MKYTVYKITNKIDNKIYIGKHQTMKLDDGYMGSGKLINRAINKYGLDNFTKEILFVYDNEQEMNDKEAELVDKDFVLREDTYNICEGGKGGWSYVNTLPKTIEHRSKISKSMKNSFKFWKAMESNNKGRVCSENTKMKMSETMKLKYKDKTNHPLYGKKHGEKTKQKMSNSASGKNNSQFGSMWITNGAINKKIKRNEIIPEGWNKGRKIKIML